MATFTDGLKNAIELIISRDPEIIDITLFSFKLSLLALILAFSIGVPLGLVIGHYDFFGKKIIIIVTSTLTGLPPVVIGVFLYILLSRTGPLGDLKLLYTPNAMIIAQLLLALPIIMSTTIQSISILPKEFFETLLSLQVNGFKRGQVMIREIRSSLVIGAVIGFGRAISEVGAILIIGGNIRWQTRTLTTASVLEISRGSPEIAIALGIILLISSFIVNLVLFAFQSSYLLPNMFLRADTVQPLKRSISSKFTETQKFKLINSFENISAPLIKCENISKSYNGVQILDIESLHFIPGNIYAVIGPNGVGKTTLLRIIAGIDKNYSGKIINEPTLSEIPYLHQTPYMFSGTVMQNLKIINHDSEAIDGIIQGFGLNELLDNNACNLSGGEKRMVAIARLFLTRPNFFVLDEPTADLDPGGVARIEKILCELRDKGIPVIMTTHNLLQARRIADKIIIQMDKSKIITGDAQEIFESKNTEIKAFIDGTLPW